MFFTLLAPGSGLIVDVMVMRKNHGTAGNYDVVLDFHSIRAVYSNASLENHILAHD
jgi:hypothetical protein